VSRWAWAEVDAAAIRHNVEVLRALAEPSALWAVVKADGYGHGAVTAARAALAGGAEGLCVALVQEGLILRKAGIDAPILVLSQQPDEELAAAITAGLHLTVYTDDAISAVSRLASSGHPVHLKVDTGMRRVGCSPADATALATRIVADPRLHLAGLFTHLAVADEPENAFTAQQLKRLAEARAALDASGIQPERVHAANSAGLLAHPQARLDVVRAGVAIYGLLPGPGVAGLCAELRPAMALRAKVGMVKRVAAGERISYGLRHTFTRDTIVATVPIGYADGLPRRLAQAGGQVLVHGRYLPLVGTVTMDQSMIDCGDVPVVVGDTVTFIGSDGDHAITADDVAATVGTIGYEIVCAISSRIERRAR
jgi:alanine racemase